MRLFNIFYRGVLHISCLWFTSRVHSFPSEQLILPIRKYLLQGKERGEQHVFVLLLFEFLIYRYIYICQYQVI